MEVNRDPEKAMYRASSLGKPSGRSPSPMADPVVNSSAEQSDDESGQKTNPQDISQWPITPDILQIRQCNETNGGKSKKLGVTWQNLTVKGISSDALYNENVLSQFNPFGKGSKSPTPEDYYRQLFWVCQRRSAKLSAYVLASGVVLKLHKGRFKS